MAGCPNLLHTAYCIISKYIKRKLCTRPPAPEVITRYTRGCTSCTNIPWSTLLCELSTASASSKLGSAGPIPIAHRSLPCISKSSPNAELRAQTVRLHFCFNLALPYGLCQAERPCCLARWQPNCSMHQLCCTFAAIGEAPRYRPSQQNLPGWLQRIQRRCLARRPKLWGQVSPRPVQQVFNL